MAETYDGAKILGEVSGLGPDKVREIWKEVKANSATLDACAGPHDFQRLAEKIGSKYRCSRCGGTVGSVEAGWYERGLAHGRGG